MHFRHFCWPLPFVPLAFQNGEVLDEFLPRGKNSLSMVPLNVLWQLGSTQQPMRPWSFAEHPFIYYERKEMIAPVKVPNTAPEKGEETKITANEERRLLSGLEQKWKSHCKRGLAVRHEMGGLLNQTLGSPTSRLPHGLAVLKKAAERLAISESELSRMRWLAHLFENVDALQSEHPDCKSWTSFKWKLPKLKSANSGTATPGTVRRVQPALRGVVNSINNLAVKFERLDANPATIRCKKLLDELKVAVKEVEDFLARQKTAEPENGKAVESVHSATAAS